MAIQKEIWTRDIQEKLYAGVDFVKTATSLDEFVTNKTVHVPQGGAIPSVSKNRTSLPGTISQRTDTDLTFDMVSFTTDPILVQDIEAMQVNYNKRQSLLSQHISVLNDRIALESLYQWALNTTAKIVTTTGTATANIAPPSGTGNRNAVKLADLANIAKILDKDEVSLTDRYLIMPSDMYWNMLIENPTLLSSDYMPLSDADLSMGVVKKVFNLNIILRSYTVAYAAGNTKKAVGAAGATTDLWGAVAFSAARVARALGAIKIFMQEDAPEYYGSVFSAEVLFGASKLRTDEAGVAMLVQA